VHRAVHWQVNLSHREAEHTTSLHFSDDRTVSFQALELPHAHQFWRGRTRLLDQEAVSETSLSPWNLALRNIALGGSCSTRPNSLIHDPKMDVDNLMHPALRKTAPVLTREKYEGLMQSILRKQLQ
jgi:hypothetical protein